ncbi:MAG: cation transporter [Planctomycetota bacterium]
MFLLALAVVLFGCAGEEPPAAGGGPAKTETVVLEVEGMHTKDCCDTAVRGMLMAVPGVVRCDVSIEEKTATVTVEDGVDPEKLVAAVKGYETTIRR